MSSSSSLVKKFSLSREKMVKDQLLPRGIKDEKVLQVMGEIPRELFLPARYKVEAYADRPLPIGEGQTISQPFIVALMTQLLALKGEERVLEIGTGSGYQAAILAKLAKEVYTLERNAKLLKKAQKVFKKLGLTNIETKVGDGSLGWEAKSPFGGIMVTAAAKKVYSPLTKQLAEGGRLVIPVGTDYWQELWRITKSKDKLKKENFGLCAFVPLVEERNHDFSQP